MGFGAYMTLNNITDKQIKTYVHDVVCMYQDGNEGSQLQEFNGQIVDPDSSWPSGQGVYIEADGGGSCALQPSSFVLKVVYLEDGETYIGDLTFTERNNWYSSQSTAPDSLYASITNGNAQAGMGVVVMRI
jgi:hypothetical protein